VRKEVWFGLILMAIVVLLTIIAMPSPADMTPAHLGLIMLSLVVVAIMLGFPTAFTLMGMGTLFTFLAYRFGNPDIALQQMLDLMVQRTYGVMTNDVLIAVPLFVFMGYLVERANLIERLFRSLHLAMSFVPGSLAVATLATCALFATATGIIGAVVTLMGLLALPAMLRSGYDIKLSAGVITAGGCLGILIPPSVLLILYGATAGVSVVKLYAGALFPGLLLAGLYILYVVVLVKLKPHLAPVPPIEERRAVVPERLRPVAGGDRRRALPGLMRAVRVPPAGLSRRYLVGQLVIALIPAVVVVVGFSFIYRVVTAAPDGDLVESASGRTGSAGAAREPGGAPGLAEPPGSGESAPAAGGLAEPPGAESSTTPEPAAAGGLAEPPGAEGSTPEPRAGGLAEPPPTETSPPEPSGGGLAEPPGAESSTPERGAAGGLAEPPGAEAAKPEPRAAGGLAEPPGAESSTPQPPGARGPAQGSSRDGGAADSATASKPAPAAFWIALAAALLLLVFHYAIFTFERLEILKMLLTSFFPLTILIVSVLGSIIFGWATPTEAAALGAAGAMLLTAAYKQFTWRVLKESVFLTAKTSAMVCWLFVGSSIFSAAFALLGGQALVENWVLGMDLTPLQFMILAQVIIFLLGWPLEWTEIIVIFMPIFIPLLDNFGIDPLFFGLMVALNLQTAFLSPPVAMAAFYLKGVAPPHVTLNQIFMGMMPFMLIQVVAMVLLYLFPAIGLWLPEVMYR
jgi:TRAP-type mannitol/chloroaromatic compound transport system permease large subunit